MSKYDKAIEYFDEAIRESDLILAEQCSPILKAELTEQKAHFETALAAMQKLDSRESEEKEFPVLEEPKCRVCGCTQNHACSGGCYWVEPDLCSQCVSEPEQPKDGAEADVLTDKAQGVMPDSLDTVTRKAAC